MPLFRRQVPEQVDQAHELAIASAVGDRPALADCNRWSISSISLMGEQPDGDRAYRVAVIGWYDEDESWPFIWEVQTGKVNGAVRALYWLPL
ncbi:MAG: hypothetical protein AAFQ89_24235 [Cyanobacteria bacterium J06626_18]